MKTFLVVLSIIAFTLALVTPLVYWAIQGEETVYQAHRSACLAKGGAMANRTLCVKELK